MEANCRVPTRHFVMFRQMEYEWDNAKAAANLRKHGIEFRDAIAALEDPNRIEDVDRSALGEERIDVIGMAMRRVLFVVTTLRSGNLCRIISARKATRDEQERYYARDRETW
ncbi:MAG: BrnT family toxin [Stellaceae bacterium]